MKPSGRLPIFVLLVVAVGLSRPLWAEVPVTIPVKLLADDKEPTVQRLWERRYRERLAEASDIIERCCNVRFKVVAVATWSSDSNIHDLNALMAEFERTVKPAPGQLAIGFTGQSRTLQADKHMGGARGPFRPHILIREWGRQVTETERLEILVHELGHYLGAVHSPEHQSVMRPDISDRQSRARGFHISFDAPNAAALRIIAAELRQRPLVHLGQISLPGKERLREIYGSLAAALPDDPAVRGYLAMFSQSFGLAGASSGSMQVVLAGAQTVVQAVTEAAAENRRLPEKPGPGRPARLSGDALTEMYVRRAAAAAARLPKTVGPQAFLMGLGVALDDSSLVPDFPLIGTYWRQVEPSAQRSARLEVLGTPTMCGRHDWAQHFSVSAAIAVLLGPQNAEALGFGKEVSDSHGESGFSFADYSADLAGIQFALAVTGGRIPLSRLQNGFLVRDFLPDASRLKEGIAWSDFVANYGLPPDARLLGEREALRTQILASSGYRTPVSDASPPRPTPPVVPGPSSPQEDVPTSPLGRKITGGL